MPPPGLFEDCMWYAIQFHFPNSTYDTAISHPFASPLGSRGHERSKYLRAESDFSLSTRSAE